MAKALVGYLGTSDPRAMARVTEENRRLRQRVRDLEAQVLRLKAENDSLGAAVHEASLLTFEKDMQPV